MSETKSLLAFEQLKKTVLGIVNETNKRLNLIDQRINEIHEVLDSSTFVPKSQIQTQSQTTTKKIQPTQNNTNNNNLNTTTSNNNNNNTSSVPLQIGISGKGKGKGANLELRVTNFESKWYVKRQYPDFEIQVVDTTMEDQIYTCTNGWNVSLHLLSGYGVYVDHTLGSSSNQSPSASNNNNNNSNHLIFPVKQGKAIISGLKFLAVSSRNGDHFNMEIELLSESSSSGGGNQPIAVWRSPNIFIRSERLINDTKVRSISDLSADDLLTKVPGVGKTYTTKFAQLGILTVRDLARFDTSPESREARLHLLNAVRKDRGTLTEAKLAAMLREAKSVVQREEEEDGQYETEQQQQPQIEIQPTKKAQKRKREEEDNEFLDQNKKSVKLNQQEDQELMETTNQDFTQLSNENNNNNNNGVAASPAYEIDLDYAQSLVFNDLFNGMNFVSPPNTTSLAPMAIDHPLLPFRLEVSDGEENNNNASPSISSSSSSPENHNQFNTNDENLLIAKKQKMVEEDLESFFMGAISSPANAPTKFSPSFLFQTSPNLSSSDGYLFSMVNFAGLEGDDDVEVPFS